MDPILVPLIVPFVTAIVLALANGWSRFERAFSFLSTLGLAAYSIGLLVEVDAHGIRAVVAGGWAAPFGIAFVADRLACIMLCLSTAVATVSIAYAVSTVTPLQERYFFHPLVQIVLLGVNWSFLTGDLFNLFVAYEVMLIGSYGVMMVGASRGQVRETLRYVAINAIGSALFVVGIGLVYAITGALNMADLAGKTAVLTGDRAALLTAVSMVLLVVFALKTAAFPIFFWLPDSYPIVPAGMNAYFAGLLTKVGVYSLLRMFVLVFRQPGHELATEILLFLSGFTMVLGVLGAMCQWDVRRILSWHVISQVGYMVMGIGLASNAAIARAAVAGTIFYVVHHIVVKSSLFLIGGIAERVSGTQRLESMGGVLDRAPGVAGLFLVCALSLAGLPPFSGFLSKLVLLRAGVDGGHWFVVAAATATSFLTLFSMTKIWSYAFWRSPTEVAPTGPHRAMMAPVAVLAAFTIYLGVAAEPFLRLANDAADDLLDPADYVNAVFAHAPEGAP